MATAQPPSQHQPATSHPAQTSPQSNISPNGAPPAAPPAPDPSQPSLPFTGMASEQVLAILKGLGPHLYPGTAAAVGRPGIDPKDSAMAAEALSNMSQAGFGHPIPNYQHYQPMPPGMEPGPSSHPRGPPSLTNPPPNASNPNEDSAQMDDDGGDGHRSDDGGSQGFDGDKPKSSGGRRSGRSATMSNDEWARQRKDNHKEVERRRRGNINEGINELGRIVPNGSGEKAKGAILSRAVQYIHHLKENEARNIEKWTLEKLLMDQAMGDLQAQLDEVRRLWEEERAARQRVEAELETLKAGHAPAADALPANSSNPPAGGNSFDKPSPKRTIDEVIRQSPSSEEVVEDRLKRQRIE